MIAAVCLVAGLGPHNPVTAAMRELHYLPVFVQNTPLSTDVCCSERFLPEYIFKVLIPAFAVPGRAALSSSTSNAYDVLDTEFERELFQWPDLRHGTVYLYRLDRLLTLSNSIAPLRLILWC